MKSIKRCTIELFRPPADPELEVVRVTEAVFVIAVDAPTNSVILVAGGEFNQVMTSWCSFFGEAPDANFCATT
jgi:hypothetical protein